MMKKLDVFLVSNAENNDFSIESIAVLCLINHCELKKDNLNLNLCLNETNEIEKSNFSDKYQNIFEFTTQIDSNAEEKLKINFQNYDNLNENLKNLALPCLRIIENNKDDDDDGCIVYSGLATLYRAIVNYVVKIKQDKRFKSLLVRIEKNFSFKLNIYSKNLTKRGTKRHV